MGSRGPAPKRSDQRRRRNKESKPQRVVVPARPEPADAAELVAAHSKPELLELAAAAGVEVPGSARKAEIAQAVAQASTTTVAPPTADPDWHPVAKRWFNSLADSGQSRFYEPSDWAMAYMIGESISRDLKPQVVGIHEETGDVVWAVIPMKGASLSAYLKAMSALMVSEGDRRRASLELVREGPDSAGEGADDVPRLDDYRDRAGVG